MSEETQPGAKLKLTKSKKGVLIIVPNPYANISHTYITSVAYLNGLMSGNMKGNILGCKYLGDAPYEQFLSADDKKINFVPLKTTDNPFDHKAVKEREASKSKINDDDW